MEKSAKITIKESEDGEPVLITTGTVARLGDSFNLTYGDEENAFVIGISDGIVTVTRRGEEEYSIMLREGRDYTFDIVSPYGNIPLRVEPKLVKIAETADGLSVRLAYDLAGGELRQSFALYLTCEYEE